MRQSRWVPRVSSLVLQSRTFPVTNCVPFYFLGVFAPHIYHEGTTTREGGRQTGRVEGCCVEPGEG